MTIEDPVFHERLLQWSDPTLCTPAQSNPPEDQNISSSQMRSSMGVNSPSSLQGATTL